jgi:hypothetical protein
MAYILMPFVLKSENNVGRGKGKVVLPHAMKGE